MTRRKTRALVTNTPRARRLRGRGDGGPDDPAGRVSKAGSPRLRDILCGAEDRSIACAEGGRRLAMVPRSAPGAMVLERDVDLINLPEATLLDVGLEALGKAVSK